MPDCSYEFDSVEDHADVDDVARDSNGAELFDVTDGEVTGVSKMASPEGCGCRSGIASVLRQMGAMVSHATIITVIRI